MHKRIFSLLSVGGVVSGTIFAVACGGSSAKPDASVKLKDSALGQDAFVCPLSAGDISELSAGLMFNTGSGSANAFKADTANGPLEVAEILALGQFSDPTVGILFVLTDGMGVFSTSEAGKFTGPPTAGTNNQDPDATIGAGFDIVNGIVDNGNGTASINATAGYLLGSAGQFVITTWTGAATANGSSTVNIAFQNSSMDGFTFDSQGMGTSDGCASAVVGTLDFPKLEIDWGPTIPTGSIRPQVAPVHGLLGLDAERLKHVPIVRIPGL